MSDTQLFLQAHLVPHRKHSLSQLWKLFLASNHTLQRKQSVTTMKTSNACLHVKCLLFLSKFNQNQMFWLFSTKISQTKFCEKLSSRSWTIPCRLMDRPRQKTNMAKLVVTAYSSFVNATKKQCSASRTARLQCCDKRWFLTWQGSDIPLSTAVSLKQWIKNARHKNPYWIQTTSNWHHSRIRSRSPFTFSYGTFLIINLQSEIRCENISKQIPCE